MTAAQIPLALEPGLATRYASLRECFAHAVYQRGLGRVAAELDVQPSNLSAMLAGERHLDSALIESYIVKFNDPLPARFGPRSSCKTPRYSRPRHSPRFPMPSRCSRT